MKWNAALSERRTIVTPLFPGFGKTPRAEWVVNVRDLGAFLSLFVREQKLAPIDVIGFSLGGWIAAEMAANNPTQFPKMVLVAPEGIRPPEGEGYIMDFFQVIGAALLSRAHHAQNPPRLPSSRKCRRPGPRGFTSYGKMRARRPLVIAWQPFLFNPSLPHLLEHRGRVADHADSGVARTISCRSRRRMHTTNRSKARRWRFRQVRSSPRSREKPNSLLLKCRDSSPRAGMEIPMHIMYFTERLILRTGRAQERRDQIKNEILRAAQPPL